MEVLHIEWPLYYRRHSLSSLELQERSDWKAMAADTHQSFSYTTLCAYTASLYIHHYLLHNYAWQQNQHTLWLHTAPQMTALLPTMYSSVDCSYTIHVYVVESFQLIVYADIKISDRYFRLYLFTSLLPSGKKEHELKVRCFQQN